MFNDHFCSEEYESLFNSTLGRVNMIGRLHKSQAKKLRARLEKIKPFKS